MAIDWRGVKREFETNASNLTALAKVYGCQAGTIRRRAAKEGWKKAEPEKTDKLKPSEPASSGPAEMKAGIQETEDGKQTTGCDDAPQIAFGDHQSLWQGVKKRLVRGLETRDVKAGLEELKVAKLAGEVLASVIKGERLALGLACGEYDEAQRVDADIAEMEAATASHGADEAVDGE